MRIVFKKDLELASGKEMEDSTIIFVGFTRGNSIGVKILKTDYTALYRFVSVNEETGATEVVVGHPRKMLSYRLFYRSLPTVNIRFGTFFKSTIVLIKKVKVLDINDVFSDH